MSEEKTAEAAPVLVVGSPEVRKKRPFTASTAPLVQKRTLGDIEFEARQKIAALEIALQAAKRKVMDELTATLSSPTRKRNDAVEALRKEYEQKTSKLKHEEEEQLRSTTDRIRNSFRDMRDAEKSAYDKAKMDLHVEHSNILKEAEKKLAEGTEAAAQIFVSQRDEVMAWKTKAETEFRAQEKAEKEKAKTDDAPAAPPA